MSKLKKLLIVPAIALGSAGLLFAAPVLACEGKCGTSAKASHAVKASPGGASAVGAATPRDPKARTIEMAVTDKGFEPAELKVKKGEPLRLVITRKTDGTCAKEIVIDGTDIRRELPLNMPVEVAFTPSEAGNLKYGCGMNKMVGGVLLVQ